MDSETSLFQGGIAALPDSAVLNVPPRRPAAMPAQAIVPWTPTRVLNAALTWVMAETPVMIAAPATAQKISRA